MIRVEDKLVEGYFIKTSDNLIFEVKGVVHPHDRIIAYVRYVPNLDSSFRKIYDLREREEYLSNGFLGYLWFSKTHGRILQAVPHNKIVRVFNPIEHMNQIRNDKSALSIATSNLVDLLLDNTGIDRLEIGVTGSQLIGVATETSDIDLVVYGESTCRKFYKRLRKNFDKIPRLERYEGELLDAHVLFRWGNLPEYQELLHRIESTKILQGVFESHQFFIRLVKRPQDVGENFGQIMTENLKTREVQCSVIKDRNSIFTPCIYQVESLNLPKLKQLVSYRGRFTEQVSSGMSVRARGRFENVIDSKTGENYQQLVLGENPSDYLVPI